MKKSGYRALGLKLAAACCVLWLVGSSVAARADDPPRQPAGAPTTTVGDEEAPLDLTGFIPERVTLAYMFYPHRVLTSRPLVEAGVSSRLSKLSFSQTLDPNQIEQVIVAMGSLKPRLLIDEDSIDTEVEDSFHLGILLRFVDPPDFQKLLDRTYTETVQVRHLGRTYYRPADNEYAPSLCLLDERTLIVAEELDLRQMLSAKDVQSAVVTRLRRVDPQADVAAIFAINDHVRQYVVEQADDIPLWLLPLARAPELLDVASLTIHSAPKIGVELRLEARGAEAMNELEQLVEDGRQMGEGFLPIARALIPRAPVELRPPARQALAVADHAFKNFQSRREGNSVVVSMQGLGELESLAKPLNKALEFYVAATQRSIRETRLFLVSYALKECYEDAERLVARANFDRRGRPLLSWRVHILPHFGHEDLYAQFHLNEPWDSPHNKTLVAKMPKEYGWPQDDPATGQTHIVAVVGADAAFAESPGAASSAPGAPVYGRQRDEFTDGEESTICLVEAERPVIWTQPDDLAFDPEKPRAGLRGQQGSYLVATCDGSTHALRADLDPESLKQLLLINDGVETAIEEFEYDPDRYHQLEEDPFE